MGLRTLCKALLSVLATLCAFGTYSVAQTKNERAYRVLVAVVSGNGNFCISEYFWIREGNGKFRLFDLNNKKELWSLPMRDDGSVSGEARIPFGHAWKVAVPPGDKPRSFTVVNLSQACNYRIDPM